MTQTQFLDFVYSKIKPGMEVKKPRKRSKIIDVTASGNIYYLIGTSNKKAVTTGDLIAVYQALAAGSLTNRTIGEISGKARPCNATTIKWILRQLDLATEGPSGIWQPNW